MKWRATSLAAPCVAIAVALQAWAQPSETTIGIWYRSSAECPDQDAFLQQLERRNVRAVGATAGDRVDFVVTIGGADGQFAGRLERQTGGGIVAMRSFEAESCEDVADALAVSLVLSIAPDDAQPATEPGAAVPTEPQGPTPSPIEPAASTSLSDPSPRTVPVDSPPTPRAEPTSWALSAQAVVASGIAPGWMFGGGVFMERQLGDSRWFAPLVRVGVTAQRAQTEVADSDLDMTLVAGHLDGCPFRLSSGATALRSCAGFEAGVLHAEFSGAAGRAATSSWFALHLYPRLDWELGSGLRAEAQAGISIPLGRYEIALAEEAEPIHRSAIVAFAAGIGIAYAWP